MSSRVFFRCCDAIVILARYGVHMSKKSAQSGTRRIDVTVVKPGRLAEMARSNAVPSAALRQAIDRAAERRR